MPAKNLSRVTEKGTYSYIHNKGIEGRNIFVDDQDYEVFLGYLKEYLTPSASIERKKKIFTVNGRTFRGTPHQPKNYFSSVELIGYSLTASQFHLLLHQVTKNSLQSFMRSLCTRYSMYFNKKYHRKSALFEGPYKSSQIKDSRELLQLSCYIHKFSSSHSSYPEYIGQRVTSWIKPQDVLNSFDDGSNGYKKFIEKYTLENKNKETPKETIVKPQQPTTEAKILASTQIKRPSKNFKFLHTIYQFTQLVVIFFVLFTLGLQNINNQSESTSYQLSSLPMPTPSKMMEISSTSVDKSDNVVLSATDSSNDSSSNNTTSSPTPKTPEPLNNELSLETINSLVASDSATLATTPVTAKLPEKIVIVKITDGSKSINIRKDATTYSEVIGTAYDGDVFEFVSSKAGWYEIKLIDNTIGYILPRYSYIEQTNN